MTSHDYNETMKAVKIADLKSRLSQHLRDVRRGETVTVMDRSTPVARILPFEPAADLVVTRPTPDAPAIGRIRVPNLRLGKGFDVVTLLKAERQSWR